MCSKGFAIKTRSERIVGVVEFPPQKVRITRVLSADTDTPAAQDLVEALKKPTSNAPFETINNTHHAALINQAELFNIIPKAAEKNQPTDIMDGVGRGKRWQPNQTK